MTIISYFFLDHKIDRFFNLLNEKFEISGTDDVKSVDSSLQSLSFVCLVAFRSDFYHKSFSLYNFQVSYLFINCGRMYFVLHFYQFEMIKND